MLPFFGPRFGNPSSTHRWGREARAALDTARERVAKCLGANADEVCFTSGGTEGGQPRDPRRLARAQGEGAHRDRHVAHRAQGRPPVRAPGGEGRGEERLLAVDHAGTVSMESARDALCDDTRICSVMWVNNEIGTISADRRTRRAARSRGARSSTRTRCRRSARFDRRAQDAVRLPGDERPQDRRTEGDRRDVHPARHAARAAASSAARRTAAVGPAPRTSRSPSRSRPPRSWRSPSTSASPRASPRCASGSKRRSSRSSPTPSSTAAAAPARRTCSNVSVPGHRQRVDAHGARPAGHRLLGRLGLPERERRRVARALGARAPRRRRERRDSHEPRRRSPPTHASIAWRRSSPPSSLKARGAVERRVTAA